MKDIAEIIKFSKKLTLLYVEDNESARDATLIILKEFFDTIVLAIDGRDALEKFDTTDIDLIISDINMPKMNGIEMSAEIKKCNPHIPIVILSAHNEKNMYSDVNALGIDKYLFKPIEFDKFIDTLISCINTIKKR